MAGYRKNHRALFLSDLHLGALGARADQALAFLQAHRAEEYYLVGDILDLWQPLLPHWSAADQKVIDHLRAQAERGARIHYLRGNHDPDPGRAPDGRRLDGPVHDRLIHIAADGRRYLVLHGDVVDGRMIRSHLMTRIGSRIDHILRLLDRGLRRLRRAGPRRTRSTVEAAISGLNRLIYRSRAHERGLVALARDAETDGVICGHFHIASLHSDHGLTYANCGDWLDSMTALAEDHDGRLILMGWESEEPEQATSAHPQAIRSKAI